MSKEVLMSGVKVSREVQESYNLIQDLYDVNPSDLVRMAPLLLALIAEQKFKDSRKELEGLENSVSQNFYEKILEKETSVRGSEFVEYLRDLADQLDATGKEMVSKDNIHLDPKENLPRYQLYHKGKVRVTLKKVATNAARTLNISTEDIRGNKNASLSPIYHRPLMAMARDELGSLLSDDQKKELIDFFRKAVTANQHKVPQESQFLERAAEHLISEMSDDEIKDLNLENEYIPWKYDRLLLVYARSLHDRPRLTLRQKNKVRECFRELIRIRKISLSR
ncbi:MAG: hypothetical protein F4073_07375 [Rhodobacteraceae bacterium]|nr:hypothetical protein [Paracoccaceae bacterium]MYF45230.1 hypothetical protein [Paracoccaceae bacterium]MYI91758.1 hypothetical protein [Paracoccaceae bacterium]